MRAAVWRAFGQPLSVEEVQIAPPAAGQMKVRLGACAICHSDIAYSEGSCGGDLPAIYRHEAAGRALAVGPDVSRFQSGEKVLVTLIRSCGDGPACTHDAPTSCHHPRDRQRSPLKDRHGKVVVQGMNSAAFAESVVVAQGQCVPRPDDLDLDIASLLACGVVTGVGAAKNVARIQPCHNIAVTGAGGVGLNVIQGARLLRAQRIVAVDTDPEKMNIARDFGATHVVLAGADAARNVKSCSNGHGLDFVFVSVGSDKAIAVPPKCSHREAQW